MIATLLSLLNLATLGRQIAADAPATVAAGTRVYFYLTAPISSQRSHSGQQFHFVLIDPIVAGGRTIAASGAAGTGTLMLAGHAGAGGHEGDLTLRLDSVQTTDGRQLTFTNQRLEENGQNNKIASAALGFVPVAGLAAHFIRGHEIQVAPRVPLQTVLRFPATVRPATGARIARAPSA